MTVLKLGETSQLGIARAANQLKPTNCPAKAQIVGSGSIMGTIPNIWPRSIQFVGIGFLGVTISAITAGQ